MRDLKNKNNNAFRELSHQSRFVLKTTYSYHFRSFTQLLKCLFYLERKKREKLYRRFTGQGATGKTKQPIFFFFLDWSSCKSRMDHRRQVWQQDHFRSSEWQHKVRGSSNKKYNRWFLYKTRCRIKARLQHTFLFSEGWVQSLPSNRVCKWKGP